MQLCMRLHGMARQVLDHGHEQGADAAADHQVGTKGGPGVCCLRRWGKVMFVAPEADC